MAQDLELAPTEGAGERTKDTENKWLSEGGSLKCVRGLQTVRIFLFLFFETERNLAGNQSTHTLLTYSTTKRKQTPHKFLQPLGSQHVTTTN